MSWYQNSQGMYLGSLLFLDTSIVKKTDVRKKRITSELWTKVKKEKCDDG